MFSYMFDLYVWVGVMVLTHHGFIIENIKNGQVLHFLWQMLRFSVVDITCFTARQFFSLRTSVMHYHILVTRILFQNSLSISGMLVWSTPCPSKNENLARTWHFGFALIWSNPPLKWKFGQDLALWIWVGLELSPPPPMNNLAKTWHFEFDLENPPPQMKIWPKGLMWELVCGD